MFYPAFCERSDGYMKYYQNIILKNGKTCCLRNGTAQDAQAVLDNFNKTHMETDYLLTYPEENTFTAESERQFLETKEESEREIEIVAEIDRKIVGTAGIEAIGNRFKVRHRAEVGLSVEKDFWGLGIGKALMNACIESAQKAGYSQLELSVVTENERAVKMYQRAGFVEYARNPKGFYSQQGYFQELLSMRLEL